MNDVSHDDDDVNLMIHYGHLNDDVVDAFYDAFVVPFVWFFFGLKKKTKNWLKFEKYFSAVLKLGKKSQNKKKWLNGSIIANEWNKKQKNIPTSIVNEKKKFIFIN